MPVSLGVVNKLLPRSPSCLGWLSYGMPPAQRRTVRYFWQRQNKLLQVLSLKISPGEPGSCPGLLGSPLFEWVPNRVVFSPKYTQCPYCSAFSPPPSFCAVRIQLL